MTDGANSEPKNTTKPCLNGGRVNFKLAEDGKGFLVEFTADGNVSDVWGVVVVKPVNVLHHT